MPLPDRKRAQQLLEDHQFHNALTNAARAVAAAPELQLTLGNQISEDPLRTGDMVVLSGAEGADDNDPKRYLRGQADIAALARRYHNARTHGAARPKDAKAGPAFDALERARIEALGASQMQGVRHNLDHRQAVYCNLQGYGRISETADPPMADILGMIVREALCGSAPPASVSPLMNV
jgi:Cobalamin biosynthesis protein CobT (nicotinate-mononucleotide:5, 6-dimethylbenzimidazole phosphoribosyltransferase)